MSHLESPKGQSSQSDCKRNYLNNNVNGEVPKIRKVGCYMKVQIRGKDLSFDHN
jgi:hypothetical protein